MKVYQAIHAVSAKLAAEGIGKTRKNDQQGYKFRGIDEVMNALAPLLVDAKLIVFPRMIARTADTRATKSGGAMYSVAIEAEFDFVSSEDGSKHTARTFGEGMDSGDKATNKAMSAAYKYAAFLTFCIPVEGSGDADADASTPEPTGYSRDDDRRGSPPSLGAAPAAEATAVDPKRAALEKPKPQPAPRGPSVRDSANVRTLVLVALDACKTGDHMLDWGAECGRNSSNWPLMTTADQAHVLAKAMGKLAEVKAADAKAAEADPQTGEIAA